MAQEPRSERELRKSLKPDQRFARTVRLTNRTEFDAVFKQRNRSFRRSPVRILVKPNRMRTARLGLVIAKRVIAKAHDRNRIKRVLRDSFRRRRSELPHWDLVVQLTHAAQAAQVRAAFEKLLDKMIQDTEATAADTHAADPDRSNPAPR
ncbi:MAG: ribonuclease P protein component [Pseudomonadota bacterium]